MAKQEKTERREKLKLLWSFLKGSKRWFLLSILAAVVNVLADMIHPQIIRAALDNAIGGKPSELPVWAEKLVEAAGGFAYLASHLWVMALAILVVAFFQVLAQYIYRVSNTTAAETLVKRMRDGLFTHIAHLPFSWHMKNRTGDIIQRCTSDIDTAKRFLSEQLVAVFRIVLLLVLSSVFMFGMHPGLAAIALIPLPVLLAYSFLYHRKIHDGFADCDENEGKLSAMAQENLTGVRVVRAFGREKAEVDKFYAHNEYYTGLWEKMAKIMSRFWSVSDVLSAIQILLVIVFGALFCVKGNMSEGEYVAFLSYNALLIWPVRQLGRTISEFSKAGVSIDRIFYIMSAQVEQDAPDAVCPDMTGDIVFENVCFSYDGVKNTLQNLSFCVPAGSTVGILGGTGSGKSTLMLLLDKLYLPEEGQGRITIGGVDVRRIKTAYLRKNIGMVLQEPFLFSRTIAENIGIAVPDAPPEAIRAAAEMAALDETVTSFAQGYDTVVGERGVTLSGGQKQRTAIARMLAQNTPIMIFDDSLSAVDTETDAKIRRAIRKQCEGATVFLISHRITTLSAADQVLVLENGRIVEQGSPEQLKSAGGIYQKIYETQRGSLEEDET